MKMMGSDDMEFSGKQHFRSRDNTAFLSASQEYAFNGELR